MEVLNTVLKEFLTAMQGSFSSIQAVAYTLIYWLIGIQIAMTAIWGLLKGGPSEMIAKFIQSAFIAAIFITLIMYTGQWMPILINGLMDIGSRSGNITSISPSAVIDQGFSIGLSIFEGFGTLGFISSPFLSLSAVVLMFVIIIVYSLIAAELALVMVIAYVLVALGPLFWAFGGLEVTREMAKNYFKKVIGIGLQLLTLYLLIGVGVTIGQDWASMLKQAAENSEILPFFVVMAAVIVYYFIIKNVPPAIAELSGIGSFQSSGAAAVGMAVNAGMQGARMAMMASGVGGAVAQGAGQVVQGGANATKLVGQGYRNTDGGAIKSSLSGLSSAVGRGTLSAGSALKQGVMRETGGKSFGQRMNQQMKNHVQTLKDKATSGKSTPSAPSSPTRANTVQHTQKNK